MSIGITELLLIGIIAIVFLNPSKVKDYVKKWYQVTGEIKKAKQEVEDEMVDLKETLKE